MFVWASRFDIGCSASDGIITRHQTQMAIWVHWMRWTGIRHYSNGWRRSCCLDRQLGNTSLNSLLIIQFHLFCVMTWTVIKQVDTLLWIIHGVYYLPVKTNILTGISIANSFYAYTVFLLQDCFIPANDKPCLFKHPWLSRQVDLIGQWIHQFRGGLIFPVFKFPRQV